MVDTHNLRKPVFSELQNIIILFCAVLFILVTNSIINSNYNAQEIYEIIGTYSLIFLLLTAFYWPEKNANAKVILVLAIVISLFQRYSLLDVFPITSTDFHRNLMFGNAFYEGIDVYTATGIEIGQLIQQGSLSLLIPYTNSWQTHAYDYPSIAIWFFWFVIHLAHIFPEINPFVIGKILLNLFDYGTAFLIYKIGKDQLQWSEINALRGSVIFLFNPFSVFEVAIEGQFESIALFFFVLGLYFYLQIKSTHGRRNLSNISYVYLGTFFFALSILTKYYSLVCLPGILYLLKDDLKLMIRQVASMFVFGFYLSIPFIVNGPYILNFLSFQADRNANPLSEIIPNVLGYHIEISVFAYGVCLIIMIFSFLSKNDKVFALALMSFFLTFFMFKNNSLFPWYFIWLMNGYPLMNYKDNYVHTFFWFIMIFIYLAVWLINLPLITFSVIIVIAGFIITSKYNPFST